jgi:hypothetical protein
MRRALLAVVAATVAVLVLAGASDERVVAGSVSLPAVRAASALEPGAGTCRGGIEAPVPFARVRLVTTTEGRPGPPLEVAVRRGGRRVARGRVPGGHPGGTVEARVGPVASGGWVEVCVRNLGHVPVVLLGAPPGVLAGRLGEPELVAAPAVVLVRDRPVSVLGELPQILDRAALFKPVPAWLLWLLLPAVVLGLPALLLAAARASGL